MELPGSVLYELSGQQPAYQDPIAELESPQAAGQLAELAAIGTWDEMSAEPYHYHDEQANQFLSPVDVREGRPSRDLYLGGSNDFPAPVPSTPLDIDSLSNQPPIGMFIPNAHNMASHLDLAQPMDSSASDYSISYPAPTYQGSSSRSVRHRSPEIPNLTVQTGGIQGTFLPPPSSRRPSCQSSLTANTPSHYSSATPSSCSRVSPAWSLTQASSATPLSSNPSAGFNSSHHSFQWGTESFMQQQLYGGVDKFIPSPTVEKM